MPTFESDTINRLAAKLDQLSLADDEQAALNAIIDRAADASEEVSGFANFAARAESGAKGRAEQAAKVKPLDLAPGASRLADALGFKLG